jgi:Putative Ig domain
VDPNQPLTIVLPASGSTFYPGTAGQALALDFFLSGGAGPYTWTVVAGQLPPGMTLQNGSTGPRDADNQLGGTPSKAGTFTFTMRVTDYAGQQATQQFTLPIQP